MNFDAKYFGANIPIYVQKESSFFVCRCFLINEKQKRNKKTINKCSLRGHR